MINTSSRRTALTATGALVAVTVLWGVTFVTVKDAIRAIPPYEFLAIRFWIATLTLALLFPRIVRPPDRQARRAILAIGAALGVGYAFQTVGLKDTSATNAGFVTGLFVIFTPLVAAVVLRRAPSRIAAAGVILAAGGLLLLSLGPQWDFRRGDLLILVTAVAFAFHIVLLGRFSPQHDSRLLATGQLAVPAFGFTAVALLTERLVVPNRGSLWFALLLTGVGASAAAFLIQTWAQRHLSPTRTAVVLTMEPVFAGLFGYLLLGERLSARGWLGAGMILVSILLVSLQPAPPSEV